MSKEVDKFTVLIGTDIDYEEMITYLEFEDSDVAILNCDKGEDQIEIKFFHKYVDRIIWSFDFQSFMEGLNLAAQELKKSNMRFPTDGKNEHNIVKQINKFRVITSHLDDEKVETHLVFGDDIVAVLNCDKGKDQVEIKFPDNYTHRVIWSFDFQSFMNGLNRAAQKLKEANVKLPDDGEDDQNIETETYEQ